MNKELIVYTDGACSGNPGKGGWGALIIDDKEKTELYSGSKLTTNNQMELQAVIEALQFIDKKYNVTTCNISIWTDSQYVKNGITTWIKSWKINGWKNSAKQPVKNKDLWIKLDELTLNKNISWNWVKGHNGHTENEYVDALARRGITELNETV